MESDQSSILGARKPATAKSGQPSEQRDARQKPRTSSLVIDTLTAIVAFESLHNLDPARVPEIGRFHLDSAENLSIDYGTALGRAPGMPCALVLGVQTQDLVCIRELKLGTETYSWRYHRIDENLEPQPLNIPDHPPTLHQCQQIVLQGQPAKVPQVDRSDSSLISYLKADHPPWLESIVSNQIEHWRKKNFEKFLRLAPGRAIAPVIKRCVVSHPFLALAHLGPRLSKTQVGYCVRRSLKGGVMYAFAELTPAERRTAADRYPDEMIRHATEKLTAQELRHCAHIDPFGALSNRRKLSGRRRALLLAHGYPYAFVSASLDPLPALRIEVLGSLSKYPEIWIDVHRGNFGEIKQGLREALDLEVPASLFLDLLKRLQDPHRNRLARFLGGTI